jgi:hypothetical protein
VSRDLNDDFGDDELGSVALDLEKGSGQVGGSGMSSYEGGGIDFDDDSMGNGAPLASLELDMRAAAAQQPASSGAPSPLTTGPPSSGQAIPPAPPGHGDPHLATHAASPNEHPGTPRAAVAARPAKPSAAAMIARYPSPPTSLLGAPMYAVRVALRQIELRTDLESLRRRRSPDVPLYEAALEAYEPKTFRLGMAMSCAALTLATFIFFLPVILRFARD